MWKRSSLKRLIWLQNRDIITCIFGSGLNVNESYIKHQVPFRFTSCTETKESYLVPTRVKVLYYLLLKAPPEQVPFPLSLRTTRSRTITTSIPETMNPQAARVYLFGGDKWVNFSPKLAG
jgi:hypothetical protein